MANETNFSNYQNIQAYVDANAVPHFRGATVMLNLMSLRNFKMGSDSIKLKKKGSLTATNATESTDHATSQYSMTSPNTLTVAESKIFIEISDKALYFSEDADLAELAQECGIALAEKFDTDAAALIDSLNGGTQVGTSGAALTAAILLQANYIFNANKVPGSGVYLLQPRQIFDVQGEILASAAAIWSNPTELSLLSSKPQANGVRGSFLGDPVFQSSNLESVNAAADWAGGYFSPQFALAAGLGPQIKSSVGYNRKKGVTEIAVSSWYDVKEYDDKAGVSIETDQ